MTSKTLKLNILTINTCVKLPATFRFCFIRHYTILLYYWLKIKLMISYKTHLWKWLNKRRAFSKISDAEHLFTYFWPSVFLAICMSSVEKRLFIFSNHFLIFFYIELPELFVLFWRLIACQPLHWQIIFTIL